MGRLTAPFAPRLDFQPKTLSVPPNAPFRWVIPPSDAPVRVTRFTLEAGPLAAFTVCPRTSITPCKGPAVCAVPQGQTFPAGGDCNADDPPGPSVRVSVRNDDDILWITAPNGPVSLKAE
ncbi:hypothetical protein [Dankookia sp. P2]|uniref:hypothetical protein n=1 Tax=Dankookia sp. P2 TaxID=3423955 RepID=UPI003D675760